TRATLKLLPVVDTIERAIAHIPDDIADHQWVKGVAGLVKQLDKSLEELGLVRIEAKPGTPFDPSLHEAIQFDEESTGDTEVVSEELQAGYMHDGVALRPALVKAARS
ncbi:MAG: nucleotide exchange factor GrpE, partial [Candidatus Saccharimonas sp.]